MFPQVATNVENAMIYTFSGPSDKGVYSKSVQQTLYQMAGAALKAESVLDNVSKMYLVYSFIRLRHIDVQ